MKEQTPLERAIANLAVSDVFVREAHITANPLHDPKRRDFALGMQIRFKPLEEAQRLDAETSTGDKQLFVRFVIDTGVRLIDVSSPEVEKAVGVEGAEVPPDKVCGEVVVKFVAEYRCMKGELPDEEAIAAFLSGNVMYHVWPYWREIVQTAFNRMRFPEVVLPMYTVPKPTQAPEKPAKS